MAGSYDDYQNEYNALLARVRSFLAGTRNRSTLAECERLLSDAKASATAMQGLAEVEDNPMRLRHAQQLLERDIAPLAKEVKRALDEMGREELFYRSPEIEYGGPAHSSSDLDSLIQSSDDLLRESHAILADTEQIGTSTLLQMGRQREQLLNTNEHLSRVRGIAVQAKNILTSMSRRAFRSRLALYCMIALLVWANCYVIYRIYKKKHVKHDD